MKHLGWVLILSSAVLGAGWIWQVGEAHNRAAHYEPVEATVVANRIHRQWANTSTERSLQQYRAEYLLEYTYQRQTYRQWETDPLVTTQRYRAEAVLGNMSPGARTTIYVDPANPRLTALDISGWRAYLGAIFFGVLASLCGIAGVAILTRDTNRTKSKREASAVVYLS